METERPVSKEERIEQIREEMKSYHQIGNAKGTANTNNETFLKYKALEKELLELIGPPPGGVQKSPRDLE